jgi:hypothetical protein
MSEPFWVPLGGGGGASLTYEGDYVASTEYQDGDVVIYNGVAFMCVGGPTTAAPDPTIWGASKLAGGSAWMTGDTKTSMQAASHDDPAGGRWLLADGSAIPAQYTALIALAGPNLPDAKGRGLVMLGTHADVNAVGKSDGEAVANRRQKHKHTAAVGSLATGTDTPDHAHATPFFTEGGGAYQRTQLNMGYQGSQYYTGGASARHAHPVTGAPTVGPQTGAEPTDSPSYVVVGNLFVHT